MILPGMFNLFVVMRSVSIMLLFVIHLDYSNSSPILHVKSSVTDS